MSSRTARCFARLLIVHTALVLARESSGSSPHPASPQNRHLHPRRRALTFLHVPYSLVASGLVPTRPSSWAAASRPSAAPR